MWTANAERRRAGHAHRAVRRPTISAMTSASDRLAGERLDYLAGSLADAAPADPLELCNAWLRDAFARREIGRASCRERV